LDWKVPALLQIALVFPLAPPPLAPVKKFGSALRRRIL
jgi:hypothetical protein